jgi:RNA polymerase primary sigma factor
MLETPATKHPAPQPARRSSDAFDQYLQQISRIPLLTSTEELLVGRIIQEWLNHPSPPPALERRGRRALDRMVSANLRLVVTISRRFLPRLQRFRLDPLDLVQAGNVGLIRAAEKFDPQRGYRFSTYAFWWIRQAIGRSIPEAGAPVRVPAAITSLAARASARQAACPRGIGMAQLGADLGEEPKRIEEALLIASRFHVLSLDQPIGSAAEGLTLGDSIQDEQGPQLRDDFHWLTRHLESLSAQERQVIALRFGQDDAPSLTKVAARLGLNKSQTQGIERRALRKLRKCLAPVS